MVVGRVCCVEYDNNNIPPISKHREKLKIRGEAEHFLTNFEEF